LNKHLKTGRKASKKIGGVDILLEGLMSYSMTGAIDKIKLLKLSTTSALNTFDALV
jgi:hypothetical protein